MRNFIERLERDNFRSIIIPIFVELGMLILFLLASGIHYLIFKKVEFSDYLIIFYIIRSMYVFILSSSNNIYREFLKNERENISAGSLRKYTEELEISRDMYFNWVALFLFLLFFTGYSVLFGDFLGNSKTVIFVYCFIVILNIFAYKNEK